MKTEARNIAVIGAGLMGHGIALVMAGAGHRVTIHDPIEAARAGVKARIAESLRLMAKSDQQIEAVLASVTVCDTLQKTVADAFAVFEAAPEKLELKQAIFAEIEAHAPVEAILASNTSVMPITDVAGDLPTAGRILGTHWWNPSFLVPLVEVVGTARTTKNNIDKTIALLTAVGKTAVTIGKALLFPSVNASLGERGVGLSSEIWWSPNHPFSSSLTGDSAKELAEGYVAASSRPWTQPIGFKHALFEVVADIVKRAADLEDSTAIIDAIKTTNMKTIVGPVNWSRGPVKNVTKTPLVAGQWQKTGGNVELIITTNKTAPGIPVGGELKLLG